jgi:hypothetical protein
MIIKTNKFFFLPVLIGFSAFSFTQHKSEYVNVSGCVKIIHPWCTDVLTDKTAEYEKPRPYPNKTLYIKEGETNDFSQPVYLEITTDKDGNFSCSLPPGKYIIVEERKRNKEIYDTIIARYGKGTKNCRPVDTTCFRKWYEKPDAILNVVHDSIKNITLTFYGICGGACDIPCASNSWYNPR